MRTKLIIAGAVLALLLWATKWTSFAFMSPNLADFVGGLGVGLLIGGVIAATATRI